MTPKVCFKCNELIQDKFIAMMNDTMWHEECLRCFQCNCKLTNSCYELNNTFLCPEDYLSEKLRKCQQCDGPIFPNELVLHSLPSCIFHHNCFLCSVCDRLLISGEKYYVFSSGSILVCQKDYDNMKQDIKNGNWKNVRNKQESDESSNNSSKVNPKHKFHSVEIMAKTHPPSVSLDEDLISEIEQSYDDAMSSDNDKSSSIRRRTPRTTIKASQLDSLKSTFVITPKPSRQIREQLAECTGLSMRVIQVWFQNRRSKERRSKLNCQRKLDRYRFSATDDIDPKEMNNYSINSGQAIEAHQQNLQMHLGSGSFNSRNSSKISDELLNEARYSSSWFVNRSLGLFNKIV